MEGGRHTSSHQPTSPVLLRLYDITGRARVVTKDHKEDARIELKPMELRELSDFHEQWMRNPLNRICFCFARYRHMVLEWLGWR
jgi:hypothetical protein